MGFIDVFLNNMLRNVAISVCVIELGGSHNGVNVGGLHVHSLNCILCCAYICCVLRKDISYLP